MATDLSKQRAAERNAGILLIAAAAAALAIANSPLWESYHYILEAKIGPVMPRMPVTFMWSR